MRTSRTAAAGGRALTCTLAITSGAVGAVAVTHFGEPARSPAAVKVESRGAPRGATVTVRVANLASSAPATLSLCSSGAQAPRCGAPLATIVAGPHGRAVAPVVIDRGCLEGERYGLALTLPGEATPIVSTSFVTTAVVIEARYGDGRLIAGLVAAGVYAAMGLLLPWRPDWTPLTADPFAGVVLPDDPFTSTPSSQP